MKLKSALRSVPGWNLSEYLLLRGFAAFLNALPIETSTWIAHRCGDFLYFFLSKRKNIALENLQSAYGQTLSRVEKEKITRAALQNLATSLMEFFRIPSMLKEASARFEFEGTEILDQAFAKGKGIIFAISHLGSWEYLAFLPYIRGYPCSVVVRAIRNPYIYRWIQGLRFKTRLNPIDKVGAAKQILKELKANHLVAILIDQWAGNDGLWLDFFGKHTSTTSVPARLARKMGAAIVPGYCLRLAPGKYKIIIRPEVPVEGSEADYEEKTTLKLNSLLEKEIRQHANQWAWGHRRWKTLDRYKGASGKGPRVLKKAL